ncbi:septal ring lytic transglycosylase RlpA family protein [Vreelandella rituensis]|uniref:Endolytic peptidoglycan transglycosylase RlpA n=1 Tax=Vreelandella rituensis TaxID=2282306 RepID=A0A368TVQ2_9GAMM|nr:septal ring lytic transglycosylase RlpA family protein [Halomonas rituensis]RCV88774.1 septal ring lytic transglycosylase RlpA family protein [Halomonas rituensis]
MIEQRIHEWRPVVLVVVLGLGLLSGCASQDVQQPERQASDTLRQTGSGASASSSERYAMSGDAYPMAPPDVSQVPDAEPRIEAPSRAGNRSSYEVWGKTYQVLPDARDYQRRGNASWYGEKFHGYATSNGEIYDMYKMSAAHRSLPLPTFVRVTSLDNGRSVIVRVNDRGPFHSDREIDLSYAAAARLGFLDAGTGAVEVEAIDPERWLAERGRTANDFSASQSDSVARAPVNPQPSTVSQVAGKGAENGIEKSLGKGTEKSTVESTDKMYLQIAALESSDSARELRDRLESELSHPVRVKSDADMHRVQVGPVDNENSMVPLREALRQAGFPQVFVVQ